MRIDVSCSAWISDDGLYRYNLTRRWAEGPLLTFVMLNPSTADAHTDDPTIRRCMGFARREGLNGIRVVNLFALRSPKPVALLAAGDAVGPDNEKAIVLALGEAHYHKTPVVAAWGAFGHPSLPDMPAIVRFRADQLEMPLHCLGTTQAGHPRHPLYVRADAPLKELP